MNIVPYYFSALIYAYLPTPHLALPWLSCLPLTRGITLIFNVSLDSVVILLRIAFVIEQRITLGVIIKDLRADRHFF